MSRFYKLLIGSAVTLIIIVFCSGFAFADENKVGTVTCDTLNMRETPDTSSKILLKLQQGNQVSIKDTSKDWYKVTYDNVTGWVSSDYVSIKDTTIGTGTVTGSVVNVRQSADASSAILAKVEKGNTVSIYARADGWYKVKTSEGVVGWVSSDYVSLRDANASRSAADVISSAESNGSGTDKTDGSKAADLIEYAKKYVGSPYVYGGTSPKGFDCSGFSGYVYSHFGIKLSRTASAQALEGEKVSKDQLKPGDLIFFKCHHSYIDHVGIYIGDGKFIHAASSSVGRVVIESFSGYYSTHYSTARRIL
ncbi:MAG: SH3 domain-containing C40 family peptidase [Bacillota bacterium]|nr:SH3 domain-containing C40 family peptidase [Bacillota bacterium]